MVMENAWRQERHFNTSVRLTNIWTCDFHFLHIVSKKNRTQRNHFWLVFGCGTSESPMLKFKWSFLDALKITTFWGYWIRTFVGFVSYRSYQLPYLGYLLYQIIGIPCQHMPKLKDDLRGSPKFQSPPTQFPLILLVISPVLMVCFCWAFPLIIGHIAMGYMLRRNR